MEIILGLIALENGLINEKVFVSLVIMALVTTFATTPILQLVLGDRGFADEPAPAPVGLAHGAAQTFGPSAFFSSAGFSSLLEFELVTRRTMPVTPNVIATPNDMSEMSALRVVSS